MGIIIAKMVKIYIKGICDDTSNTHTCECEIGWSGKICDIMTCSDDYHCNSKGF